MNGTNVRVGQLWEPRYIGAGGKPVRESMLVIGVSRYSVTVHTVAFGGSVTETIDRADWDHRVYDDLLFLVEDVP